MNVNLPILPILVAAISAFFIGGLWYSKILFGVRWEKENGEACEKNKGHSLRVFGISFIFSLIAASVFAYALGPVFTLSSALQFALMIGVGWVATSFGINYMFAARSFKLLLIDGGYHIIQFLTYGLILGLWH